MTALPLDIAPPQSAESDERYTPQWVFDGLGMMFDLDPAAPAEGGDCVPARKRYTSLEDGLTQPWDGVVWLNPPFTQLAPWIARFVEHGRGLFLGPISNSRPWMKIAQGADRIWLCKDFAFTHPTHAGRRTSMPIGFIAYGPESVEGLTRLALSGRHDGVLVQQVGS
jgi:hypothetical protein